MIASQASGPASIGSVGVTAGELARLSVVRYCSADDTDRAVLLQLRELGGAPLATKRVALLPGSGDFLDWSPARPGRVQVCPVLVVGDEPPAAEFGATLEIVDPSTMTTRLSLGGVRIEIAATADARTAVLRRTTGDVWTVDVSGRSLHLKSSKGLTQLAALLASPGREIPSTQLAGGGPDPGELGRTVVLDDETRRAYRHRLAALDEMRRAATAAGDVETEIRADREQDALVGELRRLTGLAGRPRTFTDEDERARVNVTRTLRAAVERIFECEPDLGVHLAQSIRTGSRCVYVPTDEGPRWAVTVRERIANESFARFERLKVNSTVSGGTS